MEGQFNSEKGSGCREEVEIRVGKLRKQTNSNCLNWVELTLYWVEWLAKLGKVTLNWKELVS